MALFYRQEFSYISTLTLFSRQALTGCTFRSVACVALQLPTRHERLARIKQALRESVGDDVYEELLELVFSYIPPNPFVRFTRGSGETFVVLFLVAIQLVWNKAGGKKILRYRVRIWRVHLSLIRFPVYFIRAEGREFLRKRNSSCARIISFLRTYSLQHWINVNKLDVSHESTATCQWARNFRAVVKTGTAGRREYTFFAALREDGKRLPLAYGAYTARTPQVVTELFTLRIWDVPMYESPKLKFATMNNVQYSELHTKESFEFHRPTKHVELDRFVVTKYILNLRRLTCWYAPCVKRKSLLLTGGGWTRCRAMRIDLGNTRTVSAYGKTRIFLNTPTHSNAVFGPS